MVVTSGGEFHSIPKDIVTSVINAPRVWRKKSDKTATKIITNKNELPTTHY